MTALSKIKLLFVLLSAALICCACSADGPGSASAPEPSVPEEVSGESSPEEFEDFSPIPWDGKYPETWEELTADRETVFAFLEKYPDPMVFIENPSSAPAAEPVYADPKVPAAIYDFLYTYYNSFVTLEAPDFSALEGGGCSFAELEQMLRYQTAKDRLGGSYWTELALEVTAEPEIVAADGVSGIYACECLFEAKSSLGSNPGGREHWKFELDEKGDIVFFEWVQNGSGGLYSGLVNNFDDIRSRFPEYKNDSEMIATLGICEYILGLRP